MITRAELMELLATGFNRFMYDQFLSTEQINSATTGSGVVTPRIMELEINTGIAANSTARCYYNTPWFNPVYSTAYFRFYLKEMSNVFAFIGFKENTAEPTFNMTQSHSGIMCYNGKMYFSTANGTNQKRVEITGIDMTKDMIYKIEYNKLSTFPLPQIIPYFDTFRIITPDRIWTLKQTNETSKPKDEVHYLLLYIKNNATAEKYLRLKSITYGEEYAD